MRQGAESAEPADVWSMSFAEAVRHAYFVEHGVSQSQRMAELAGLDKSPFSQIFTRPATAIQGKTLAKLMAPISLPELRTEIFVAWGREIVGTGELPAVADRGRLATALMRRNRPDLALRIAVRSFEEEGDAEARWGFAVQALACGHRLDLPGDAIDMALRLRRWGEESGMRGLAAAGVAHTARAMRRTLHFSYRHTTDERLKAEQMASAGGFAAGLDSTAARHAAGLAESEYMVDAIRTQELFGGKEEDLRRLLVRSDERLAVARNDAARARAHQLAARLRLALGDAGAAEAHVRASLDLRAEDPISRLDTEPLKARLCEVRGDVDGALEHLRWTVRAGAKHRFVYVQRVAESELARISIERYGSPKQPPWAPAPDGHGPGAGP